MNDPATIIRSTENKVPSLNLQVILIQKLKNPLIQAKA